MLLRFHPDSAFRTFCAKIWIEQKGLSHVYYRNFHFLAQTFGHLIKIAQLFQEIVLDVNIVQTKNVLFRMYHIKFITNMKEIKKKQR